MTLALRFATVGSAVVEGNRLAVSVGRGVTVGVAVGVIESVCVIVDARTVFVGTWVAIEVGAIGVVVRVQASENITTRIKIKGLRLMDEIFLLSGNIPEYLRSSEGLMVL